MWEQTIHRLVIRGGLGGSLVDLIDLKCVVENKWDTALGVKVTQFTQLLLETFHIFQVMVICYVYLHDL